MGLLSGIKKAAKKLAQSPLNKQLRKISPLDKWVQESIGLVKKPGDDAADDLTNSLLDPDGLDKPFTMPEANMEALAEARRRAMLRRQQAGGRDSTILADKDY